VALNPGTPVCALSSIISELDMVLIMTVDPGFGGQSFIPSSLDKLKDLEELCHSRGVAPRVEVDGGVSAKNVATVVAAGADVIVAGSAVFGDADRAAAIAAIRSAASVIDMEA
jgi:ribulose-phosphate 3-epimerase